MNVESNNYLSSSMPNSYCIIFNEWIFRKTFNTKNFDYEIGHNIQLQFKDWKYWEFTDDTFTRERIENVIYSGFANFMADFIDIQHLAKYLDQIEIYNSFGIYRQKMK